MKPTKPIYGTGAIAWMAQNPVAANLLMIILLLGGVYTAIQIQKEVFPRFELDIISVSVSYPGAAPSEVETGVLQPVEEAIQGLDGIREMTARAREGRGSIEIELTTGTDRMKTLQDIDQAIARIRTFPEEAEEPEVTLRNRQREAMEVALFGPVDVWSLRILAERLRDRFLNDPNLTLVDLGYVPEYVTHIEINANTLRTYGLTISDVAQTIRQSSQNIPAGAVQTYDGEILLRLNERRTWAEEFASIEVVTNSAGGSVLLGDIATIEDGFEEGNFHSRFNGEPSIELNIYRSGNESPLDIEKAVYSIMDDFENTLPPGVEWRINSNNAQDFRERLHLILENGATSVFIVLLILSLFMAARLAFWVMLGMAISYVVPDREASFFKK